MKIKKVKEPAKDVNDCTEKTEAQKVKDPDIEMIIEKMNMIKL